MVFEKTFDITIYETTNFKVSQDWEVPIIGFFILSPKRKIKSLTELSKEESYELIDILRKVRKAMYDVLKIKEICIFQDEKTKFDFHIWILPRYDWMDSIGYKPIKEMPSLKEILKYAEGNMKSPENVRKVKKAAKKVKEYLDRG
jgi:diadenosine tetraphosphate (Ap4A) HIT family hydrolase